MTKLQFLAEAIELLEDHKDGEDIQGKAESFLRRYYATLKRKPIGVQLNPYLTKQYEKAKALVASGNTIKDACERAGITRDQWYRRKNVDVHGKCRPNKRDY